MDIQTILTDGLGTLWDRLMGFIPNLVAGILILLLGYFVSRLLAGFVRRVTRRVGIDKTTADAGIQEMLGASGVSIEPSELIARMVFLFSMLIFVVTAADSLGLDAISATIDTFILFLPKVVAALIIALLGLYFAQLLRDAVNKMTESLSVEYARMLASVAYGLCILVVGTLAISQLQIETALLQTLIAVVLGVCGLGAAIALGFGTQGVARNIVSGVYARDLLEPGEKINWQGKDGEVVEIGTVTTIIEYNKRRRLHIPNDLLLSETFETSAED